MNNFKAEFSKIYEKYKNGQYVNEFNQLKASLVGKTVVLFGAAWIGDFFYNKLVSSGIPVECFADNYAKGVTPAGHSPIITPSELKAKCPDASVIIACDKGRDAIYNQLLELGYAPEQIIKYPRQLLAIMSFEEFEKYVDGYEEAFNFFDDNISKEIILSRIKCYLFGTTMERSTSPQYFEKGLLQLTDNEIFVDGGFFTGDTTEEFLRQTNGNFNHIYGFEPDKYCIQKVSKAILDHPRIDIITKGLHSKEAQLKFATTGGTSQASGGNIVTEDATNVTSIPVTSLDIFFADKKHDDLPTYIKLDVEGAEEDAIIGMKNIIKLARPKLAICVYHKPEDMYKLYKLICEIRTDYKFYLRHYANYFWETVLYAM